MPDALEHGIVERKRLIGPDVDERIPLDLAGLDESTNRSLPP